LSETAESTKTNGQTTPTFTRKLIRKIYLPIDEMSDDLDINACRRKVYGPNIKILAMEGGDIPEGWILVDGNLPPSAIPLLTSDYGPQPPKIKKRWIPHAMPRDDPNAFSNRSRAEAGLPPVDRWNIGIEYVY
jgi:hypothetical protein